MPRASNLESLLAVQVLAAGLEMDRVVAVGVVGIEGVVEVRAEAHVDTAERVDHVAKRLEVDRDEPVERQPGDLADLVLGRHSAAVLAAVLLGDTADDVRVRDLVRGVDLVRPDPVRVALEVHVDHEVARDRKHHHAVGDGVDADGHDRVGQIGRVVLIAAATQQEHVDPLAVLELVRDRAGRRIDRLDHLADRVDVVASGGGDEVVESLVGQRRPDDQDVGRGRSWAP